ncbi:MAG: hypothetical protein F4023_04740 [Acidobacteria bacterium]|nr:hypothetical protein [Acidobacteriota bacterium]MYA46961.1 hypothetical protein [Acidobacteriota bacterium]MYH20954.1 hypothetical protein [Acidobacteriota bacterium]MYI39597.1 hypothetical protein [Acidobacteriota bacterium]MYK78944.1 hypothetical protein [Acidobacteriota bacterium]
MSPKRPPSPRASLEKRPLKVLSRLAQLDDPGELPALLGPLVAKRHSFAAYRKAARELVAERAEARARRLGEPTLSDAERQALGRAGSRLLGLVDGGSPLAGFSDEALEAVRSERDPGRLADRLGELDPAGGWEEVPRMGLLNGLVLVAVSSEAERRWRLKDAANRARTRRARENGQAS